jgi:hypothetical protein
VSRSARLAAEVSEFLRVALLFLFLRPAVAPLEVAISAAPGGVARRWWYGVVLTALAVGFVRWLDPPYDLARALVVGLSTTATFAGLSVLSGLSRAVDAGGSWLALAGVLLLWAAAVGVGVLLASARTWRWLRARVAPA